MPRRLSQDTINTITFHLDSGLTYSKIHDLTGVATSTIGEIHQNLRPNHATASPGRPTILSSSDIRHANRLIGTGTADNTVQVTKVLQNIKNQTFSSQTTCNHMRKAGFKAKTKIKKPLLKSDHKKARLEFAIAHQHWTVEDWKRVVWSDETKFNRIGSDGRKWVWVR